ncbi:MAG: hypothetical protein ACYSUX_08645 [Planctomycetota bacterium]|jgi:hypothetical protein
MPAELLCCSCSSIVLAADPRNLTIISFGTQRWRDALITAGGNVIENKSRARLESTVFSIYLLSMIYHVSIDNSRLRTPWLLCCEIEPSYTDEELMRQFRPASTSQANMIIAREQLILQGLYASPGKNKKCKFSICKLLVSA